MGTDFVLAYPDNYGSSTDIHLYVVSTESNFSGHISSPHPGVSRNFSTTTGLVTLYLPTSLELPYGSSNRAVYVKSSRPVSVFGIDHKSSSGDAFYVYPRDKLGQHYTAVSLNLSHSAHGVYIALVGTTSHTRVTITLNTVGSVVYNGKSYKGGENIILLIHEMETVQLQSKTDLSGTSINSSKPIAVMTGNECSNPFGLACNQFIEYLIPNGKCGKTLIVPPVKGTKKMIKVISPDNSTTLTIHGGSLQRFSPQQKEVNLDPDETYTIASDKSTCVYLWSMGSQNNPMMTFLPSVEHYVNYIVFPKPTIQVFSNYMSIVIKSASLPNLRLNNNTLTNYNIQSVVLDSTEYSTFWMALPTNASTYHVYSTSPDDRFGAIVYGYKSDEAYGIPAALRIF